MTGYLLRRLGQSIVVLLGVTLIAFLLQHLLPGSVARAIIGTRATSQQVAAFNREYGLDRALPIQYLSLLNQLLHGNLGYSFKLGQSVDSIVAVDLPKDGILVGTSTVLALLIAVPAGLIQAVRRNKFTDYSLTAVSFILYSMPAYLLGLILIATIAIDARLLPSEAPQEATVSGILSHPSGLLLPIATLTLVTYALFSRYMRSSAIENLAQDYIRTARAKGLRQIRVVLRHLLPNSLIPVITIVGLSLPGILTSGLIIEAVFNFPGIGLEYYNAAISEDYPVEIGITVLVGLFVVVGNLLADVAYAVLDPRVRYAKS
jgi:peptide/nickel transport system permease protein